MIVDRHEGIFIVVAIIIEENSLVFLFFVFGVWILIGELV